jgi:hypothetical protein
MRKFVARAKTGSATDYLVDEFAAGWETNVMLLAGRYPEARDRAQKSLARLDAVEKGNVPATASDNYRMGANQVVYLASMAMGDFPTAEAAARRQALIRASVK